MNTTKLNHKILSALMTILVAPGWTLANELPQKSLPINTRLITEFLTINIQTPVLPQPVPSPLPDQGETDYDFDENGDEADEPSNKPAQKLDGDGTLALLNNKTLETLEIRYRDSEGNYIPKAMDRIKHFFRCRLTGEEHNIAPGLLEIMDSLQHKFGEKKPITLLSGYRSPKLNSALTRQGASKHSLHMTGIAADINIPGVKLLALKNAARALQARDSGGVGYYPKDGFVHVDCGRVRYWEGKARIIKHKRIKRGYGHSTNNNRVSRTSRK